MIIYATFTETSIARLFAAGLIPGITLALLYMVYIAVRASINPTLAPRDERVASGADYRRAGLDVIPFVLLITIVLGSIYGGFATPTEAGAVGVAGALLIAGGYRRLTWQVLSNAVTNTMIMSGNVLFVVFTSMIFAYATALAGFGETLVEWVAVAELSPTTFLLILLVFYAVLGCFMEGLGMIAITIPIIYPVLLALEIDPIWFGVFVVIMVELGQLTPPLGVILFVVASSWTKMKVEDVVVGVLPFYIIIVLFVLLLMAFPGIALWFPSISAR
jgi:tripartite ATP-independent transporter DctM subunit